MSDLGEHRRDWQWNHQGRNGYDGVHTHEGQLVWYHDNPYNNQDSAGRAQSFEDFLSSGPAMACPPEVLEELTVAVLALTKR